MSQNSRLLLTVTGKPKISLKKS